MAMKRRLLREIEADPDCGGTLLSVTRMSIYIGFIFGLRDGQEPVSREFIDQRRRVRDFDCLFTREIAEIIIHKY